MAEKKNHSAGNQPSSQPGSGVPRTLHLHQNSKKTVSGYFGSADATNDAISTNKVQINLIWCVSYAISVYSLRRDVLFWIFDIFSFDFEISS
jgi:hypothetical protein